MYSIFRTKQFKKSFKKIISHKNFKKEVFEYVVLQLQQNNKLDEKFKDHQLIGNYVGYRECHLQNDILLIYYYENKEIVLVLVDIGSHSELF